jgi:hypothetical protein
MNSTPPSHRPRAGCWEHESESQSEREEGGRPKSEDKGWQREMEVKREWKRKGRAAKREEWRVKRKDCARLLQESEDSVGDVVDDDDARRVER